MTITQTQSQCPAPGGAGSGGAPGNGGTSNDGGSVGPDDGEGKDGAPSWAYIVAESSAVLAGRRRNSVKSSVSNSPGDVAGRGAETGAPFSDENRSVSSDSGQSSAVPGQRATTTDRSSADEPSSGDGDSRLEEPSGDDFWENRNRERNAERSWGINELSKTAGATGDGVGKVVKDESASRSKAIKDLLTDPETGRQHNVLDWGRDVEKKVDDLAKTPKEMKFLGSVSKAGKVGGPILTAAGAVFDGASGNKSFG